jgi:hypothetical protein
VESLGVAKRKKNGLSARNSLTVQVFSNLETAFEIAEGIP